METTLSFSPAEAAALTGVSPTKQRDWRRHGYISEGGKGWTMFDADRLSEMFLVNVMAARVPMPVAAAGARTLAPVLSRYVRQVVAGQYGDEPSEAGALLPDGSIRAFATFQQAVTAAEGAETILVFPLQAIATPFAIRVRDAAKARKGVGG